MGKNINLSERVFKYINNKSPTNEVGLSVYADNNVCVAIMLRALAYSSSLAASS